MKLHIVGAGMAGLLAANMLHRRNPVVLERAKELPNNHSAVLRFRSSIVGDTLGIPFRRVPIIKSNVAWRNPVADAMAYSRKNSGVSRSDRSISAGLVVADRFIAPNNLIDQMAKGLDIRYDVDWRPSNGEPAISTIPMPRLMDLLGWPVPGMSWSPAINIKARVAECDAYVTLMVPDPKLPFSRVSITGDELIIEIPGRSAMPSSDESAYCVAKAAELLGLELHLIHGCQAHVSRYAKILPINEEERREFIYETSAKHNIYSLGRFATWRPGLLMDDLVQDIRKIDGWLSGRRYGMHLEGRS